MLCWQCGNPWRTEPSHIARELGEVLGDVSMQWFLSRAGLHQFLEEVALKQFQWSQSWHIWEPVLFKKKKSICRLKVSWVALNGLQCMLYPENGITQVYPNKFLFVLGNLHVSLECHVTQFIHNKQNELLTSTSNCVTRILWYNLIQVKGCKPTDS